MTSEEHELMIMMFARVYELIGQIRQTLKSREIWTGDDSDAFADLVRETKLRTYAAQARSEYLRLAKEVGLKPPGA